MIEAKIPPKPAPELVHRSACTHCHKTGRQYPDCEECQGFGFVIDPATATTADCPECENEPCNECYFQ